MKKILLALVLLFLPISALAAEMVFMVIDNNSYLANLAVDGLETGVKNRIKVISNGELTPGGEPLRQEIEQAKIIIVDVMGKELEEYLQIS